MDVLRCITCRQDDGEQFDKCFANWRHLVRGCDFLNQEADLNPSEYDHMNMFKTSKPNAGSQLWLLR